MTPAPDEVNDVVLGGAVLAIRRADAAEAEVRQLKAAAPPREPTSAMQKAMVDAMFYERGDLKLRELYAIVRRGWRAGYDAARSAEAGTPDRRQAQGTGATCEVCGGSGEASNKEPS